METIHSNRLGKLVNWNLSLSHCSDRWGGFGPPKVHLELRYFQSGYETELSYAAYLTDYQCFILFTYVFNDQFSYNKEDIKIINCKGSMFFDISIYNIKFYLTEGNTVAKNLF